MSLCPSVNCVSTPVCHLIKPMWPNCTKEDRIHFQKCQGHRKCTSRSLFKCSYVFCLIREISTILVSWSLNRLSGLSFRLSDFKQHFNPLRVILCQEVREYIYTFSPVVSSAFFLLFIYLFIYCTLSIIPINYIFIWLIDTTLIGTTTLGQICHLEPVELHSECKYYIST